MYFEKLANNQYALRLARGEDVFSGLEKFCRQEQVDGAHFYGLGAVDKAELAHYDVGTQKYSTKKFNQPLEVLNLTGNISFYLGDIVIHAHGTFSDPDMHCIGGHVVGLQVSGTVEIFLTKTSALTKSLDTVTGLKLLDLPNSLDIN